MSNLEISLVTLFYIYYFFRYFMTLAYYIYIEKTFSYFVPANDTLNLKLESLILLFSLATETNAKVPWMNDLFTYCFLSYVPNVKLL